LIQKKIDFIWYQKHHFSRPSIWFVWRDMFAYP